MPQSPDAPRAVVMVVDDDDGLRKALGRRIALMGYAASEHGDAASALDEIARRPPDCLIVDLAMPGMTGLELQQAMHARGFSTPTIFLTGCGTIPSSVTAMRDGAIDFLEKPVEDSTLADAIERGLAQGREAAAQRAQTEALRLRAERLTDRQREVFLAVIRGAPNKVIAYELSVSERTVKAHRKEVMEKLAVSSVAELTLAAARLGLAPE